MGTIDDCGEDGAVRKLVNFLNLNVEWVKCDEAFSAINLERDNEFNLRMPTGINNFIDEMERQVPGSRDSMTTVFEMCKMIDNCLLWLNKHNNEPGPLAKIKMLIKYKDLMKLVPLSTDEVLRKIKMPDKARQIFESYWDYIGCDSTRMSFAIYAFMTYSYILQSPYVPLKKSHEISLAYDKCIRENGSDIWYNSEVSEIKVEKNKVIGVQIKNGPFINCERVMCNLMPNVAFDKLIDHKEVPIRDRKALNAREISLNCAVVYLGLDIPYEKLGFKGYDCFIKTTGDNRKQFESMASLDTHDSVTVTILNEVIPNSSPKGTCNIALTKFFSTDITHNLKEEDYFKFKDRIARDSINQFEKACNIKIRDHIEEIEVATPVTFARYLGTPQGDVYGYTAADWDGMFPRVQSQHKVDYTIKGLRFCGGHGANMDGYSQSMLSGMQQAQYMLEDIKEGK